jgi:hypothetical protein
MNPASGGGVNDNSPCIKHLVVVNVRATTRAPFIKNVLDMKLRVRDTARLAFIYFRKQNTYLYRWLVRVSKKQVPFEFP